MKNTLLRWMSILLTVSLFAACLPLTAFAAYENTHTNTGDQIADIVAVAKTQIGYHEGSLAGTTSGTNNYTKYGVWYDTYFNESGFSYGAWCAMFVSWCAYEAGIPSDTVYYHAYCPYGVTWYKNKGLWQNSAYYGGSYTPKAGDIIYFHNNGGASHIGIVTGCSGGYVYTVEGNTSSATYDPEGNVCANKSYALSNTRILGYGTPLYENAKGTSAEKIGTYKITASSLNVRSGPSTTDGIVGSLENGKLVAVSEISNGWGKVTLDDGTVGWCSIVQYGDYIGIDALNTELTAAWNPQNLQISSHSNGCVTFTNLDKADNMAIDFPLPVKVGTRTTPYLNMSVSCHSGGWYFGLTQSNSGYFMMRECTSGNELVEATTATFMQTDEVLQISLLDWWQPEADYRIDTLRLYLNPGASVTVNYCYFSEEPNVVTSVAYNMRKGGDAPVPDEPVVNAEPVNLLVPDGLFIPDRTKAGGYSYVNGLLTVNSKEANGYDVSMTVNKTVKPNDLHRFLVSVESDVRFDIEIVATTADGDRTFSLRDDFYYEFTDTPDGDYIPAFNGSAGMDFLGCYTFNNVFPADGNSVIKSVNFRVGGIGTLKVNSCQLASNDSLTLFTDSVSKSDSTPDNTSDPALLGDINADGEVSTADARELLSYLLGSNSLTQAQLDCADYNGDGEVSTMDAREMLKVLLA